jgi:hypothetical protein
MLAAYIAARLLKMAAAIIALMMETASTSEMLVNLCQATWRNNPKDGHFHTCHRENLKSHSARLLFAVLKYMIIFFRNNITKSKEAH